MNKPKYMPVGAYTFPVFGEVGKTLEQDHPIPSPEEVEHAEATEAAVSDEVPTERRVTPSEKRRLEEENKRWEGIIATCRDTDYKLVEIPMVEILPCRSTYAILGALNRLYAKLRFFGLPVYRLHSDCAGEFTHGSLRTIVEFM